MLRLEVAARRSGGRAKGRFMGLEEDEDAEDRVRWRRKLLGLRSRESIQLAGER